MLIARTAGRVSRAAAFIAAAALVAGSVAPAYAAGPDPEGAAPAAAPAAKQEKQVKKSRLVCVDSQITGSRLNHRTCKTRDQWIREDGVDPLNQTVR